MGVWYSRVELGDIEILIKILLNLKILKMLKKWKFESELVSLLGILSRLYIIVLLLVREEYNKFGGWLV